MAKNEKQAAQGGRQRGADKMPSLFNDLIPNKGFPLNRGKDNGPFHRKSHIEALEDEIAARIEANHYRPGWW